MPRLPDLDSLLAMPILLLAAVSCGGGVTTGSDASSTVVNAGDAGLTCADPVHVSIGETLSGSTCGGTDQPPTDAIPCANGGPVAFFYVDAPSGAVFSIDSTPAVLLAGYVDCAEPFVCDLGKTSVTPPAKARLFSVQLPGPTSMNATCGDFTITVVSQ
jgi:hypothetical protein